MALKGTTPYRSEHSAQDKGLSTCRKEMNAKGVVCNPFVCCLVVLHSAGVHGYTLLRLSIALPTVQRWLDNSYLSITISTGPPFFSPVAMHSHFLLRRETILQLCIVVFLFFFFFLLFY